MKFGQFVKMDKLKKKIDEDEKTIKKSRPVEECSDEFNEQTKLLHTVMRFTQTFGSSDNLIEKTECILVIFNLLTTHLNRFIKNNTDYQGRGDDGIVFEKKESTGV